MAEAAVSLTERIIKDPDFDLLLANAQKFLAEQPKPTLEQRILSEPDFDLLLNNAKKLKREREKSKPKRAKTKLALATTAAALTGVASVMGTPATNKQAAGQKESVLSVQKESTPTQTITPQPTPTSTPTPEIRVIKTDLLRETLIPKIYKQILEMREQRLKSDPDFAQRINLELAQERINILVVGGRQEEALTDLIQVISYHIPTHTASIISIPRDLQSPEVLQKTKNPRNSRINQAWGEAGGGFDERVDFTKRILENATSLPMDLFVYLNFEAVSDLIDRTVGEIEVYLDKPIIDNAYPTENYGYKRIYYPAGLNKLNGEQALEVARSRHGSSDYDRAARQQLIFEAFLERLFAGGGQKQLSYLKPIYDSWHENINEGALKPDFDINSLIFSDLWEIIRKTPQLLWQLPSGGLKLTEKPTITRTGVTNRNFVVGAGVTGLAITKVSGGNPNTLNPRRDYWASTRRFTEKFLTENIGEPPAEEAIELTLPPKEQRILYPKELTYSEVKPWLGKMRNSHDSVITESLFTRELTQLPADQRQKMMEAIASTHAKALIKHYGDTETIIGLDPGHGGSDIGSSGITPEGQILAEKDLTWQLSQMIADQIYQQSAGKYLVIFLRPQNPHDEDFDKDGIISPVERLQKRKALLLQQELSLRKYGQPLGKNIVYLSVHLNGSQDPSQRGTEVFWPNETAVTEATYRDSSKKLAEILQQEIIEAINSTGYVTWDRGAKQDPDRRHPLSNAESTTGPYIVLGSPKLDRDLKP